MTKTYTIQELNDAQGELIGLREMLPDYEFALNVAIDGLEELAKVR